MYESLYAEYKYRSQFFFFLMAHISLFEVSMLWSVIVKNL